MADDAVLGELKKLLPAGNLPELGPGPRSGILSNTELTKALDTSIKTTVLPAVSKDLTRGIVLLWHDHLDAAHEIAQSIENPDGSFLHGIVHRREPDFSNAGYWFRRAGSHPCYPKMAQKIVTLLQARNARELQSQLTPRGEWKPFVFIELCEEANHKAVGDEGTMLLRQIQGIESEIFLEYLVNG